MAALSEFIPLVGQHCPNAPSIAIEFWARRAAIEFCRRTLALQGTLASFDTVADQAAYALSCGAGLQATKLLACRLGTRRLTLVTPAEIYALADMQSASGVPEGAYLSDTSELTLYPPPAAVEAVEVRLALEPTQSAATIPDELFNQHAGAIAYGAAAKLAMTPDGRDERLASAMSGLFEEEIGRSKATTYFNRARSGPRTTPTWC